MIAYRRGFLNLAIYLILLLAVSACTDQEPKVDIVATVVAMGSLEERPGRIAQEIVDAIPTPTPLVIEVPVEKVVTHEIIKEVPVEVVVEKEVIRTEIVEVPREVVVTHEVIREVPVEKVVVQYVAVTVTPTPTVIPVSTPTPAGVTTLPTTGESSGAKFGGIFRYVPQGSIQSIDTMATGAMVTGTVGRHAYDQLFWRNANYEIFPQMLESWSISPDSKEYTFKVRPGQTFHNGDPLRMVDIAESHNRFARVDGLGRQLLGISAGNEGRGPTERKFNQVLDDANNTIVMKFEEPTAMVLEFLAQLDPRQPSIMHEDIWSAIPGQPVDLVNGTGGFKLLEWIPRVVLRFEKHAGYIPNAGEPWNFTKGEITQYLDGFEAWDIPDHATRVAALQTGGVDVLDDFRIDLAATLTGASGVEWSPIRDGNYGGTSFNLNHPPFDTSEAGRLARRAVYAVAPNDRIMQAAVGDESMWTECYLVVHCGTPWMSVVSDEVQAEGIKTRSGDLDTAKRLLGEAEALRPGTKDMPVRIIAASDMPFMPEAGLVMWEAMEQMGFTNVELVSMDWASRVALTSLEGPWEVATTWSNFANGLNPLAPHMPSSPTSAGWEDAQIDDLRGRFLTETDPVALQSMYDDMNRAIYNNPHSINHFMFSPPRAIRSDVKNFCLDCLFPILHNVWLDR